MEIYLVKLALLFDRKLNIPLLPIKIGEVDKANTSIPIPPKTGLANDAHIIMALYKKPQGNIAVKRFCCKNRPSESRVTFFE